VRELVVGNHALGDRAELERLWAEHGYWFFRDVLDPAALGRMRAEYVKELDRLGVTAGDPEDPDWNGRPLDDFPVTFHDLHERGVWPEFVASPKIKAFFEEVFADELFWLPMDYYRALPPSTRPDPPRNIHVHQDGMQNPGVTFATCWMPLNRIDAATGGLYLAAGQHRRGYLQKSGEDWEFADGPIDPASWARAEYRPGDVVIFAPSIPHYGDANRSQRFRLSLDIRAVRRSTPIPLVGLVTRITDERVTIACAEAGEVSLVLDDETIISALVDPTSPHPVRVTREVAPAVLPAGTRVMATRENGRALVFRAVMH
jgi:hypothetical protein